MEEVLFIVLINEENNIATSDVGEEHTLTFFAHCTGSAGQGDANLLEGIVHQS